MRTRQSRIATAPLAGICAVLAATALPLAGKVPFFALALLAVAVAFRLLVNRYHFRLPSLPTKVLVLALGVLGVATSYHTVFGVEPGLGVLLMLAALKLLETNTARDFQVLALIAWFLCLCGLFFNQDLAAWLYVAACAFALTLVQARFHAGATARGWKKPARLAATLFAQALPLVALLFFFFPRLYGGFRFTFGRPPSGITGMSDRLEPGQFASVAQSSEVVFRVEFPGGAIPAHAEMYWRGGVLWRGDGLFWVRGPRLAPERARRLGGEKIVQTITLQPSGERWAFALDHPAASEDRRTNLEPGGYLEARRAVHTTLRYTATSFSEITERELPRDHRAICLEQPKRITPRVQQLVEQWRAAAGADDARLVAVALAWFKAQPFEYTLSPGPYGGDGLDRLLFEKQAGFCEHYAAAFATLMRIAGVPARIIIGYQGGEPNARGDYVIIRQSDAHCWAEVWLAGRGWARVDPTGVVAGERITRGLEQALDGEDAGEGDALAGGASGKWTLAGLWRETRMAWDSVNYQWDVRVLNYNEDEQRSFLAQIGLADWRWPALGAWTWAVATLLLLAMGAWLRRPAAPRRDPVARGWARLGEKLAAAGVAREPWEGPQAFAARAAVALPQHAPALEKLAALYIAQRYEKDAPPPAEFVAAARAFAVLRKK